MPYYNTCSPHNNAYSMAYSYPVPQPSTFTQQGEEMPLTQRGQPHVSPLLPYDRQHIANPPSSTKPFCRHATECYAFSSASHTPLFLSALRSAV